jgi:hypothetical protein
VAQLTNYGENALADWFRGAPLSLPDNYWIALGSAATDSSFTELSGTGYARVNVACTLANWAGTQGPGTTLPSTGTTHRTSNNAAIDFGTAGAAWGTASVVGLFTAETAGECVAWAVIAAPIVISDTNPVSLPAGTVRFTFGVEGGVSDFLANKVVDRVFRGVLDWNPPASYWIGYTKTAPTNSTPGTEPTGAAYARQEVFADFSSWFSTSGDNDVSAGTDGRIANAVEIQFPVPTGNQGTITHVQIMDAATGGNVLFWRALAAPQTLSVGGLPPRFEPDTLGITFA